MYFQNNSTIQNFKLEKKTWVNTFTILDGEKEI